MNRKTLLAAVLMLVLAPGVRGQGLMGGHVTGTVQVDGQTSREDKEIGSDKVDELLLLNARTDILYTNGDFSGGLRFELYQNPMLGFDPKELWKNEGIANYFLSYNGERMSVTAGYFYEQFGSGMILRTYEDRNLGYDNALFGLNLQFRPVDGVVVKALSGKQKMYWDFGSGLVRGVDAEVNLGSLIRPLGESKFRVTLGGGFVSKYEDDETIGVENAPGYRLNLPLNVGAGAVRADLGYGGWSLQAEYARKGQDPNAGNDYIYREGQALMLNLGYSQKGFSAGVQAKRIDNMGFKSVRTQSGEVLFVNYLPPITKNHAYAFLAMYPYATQVNGEQGLQGDVMYKIKKGTLLGGQYGTDLHLNSSVVTMLDTTVTGGKGTEGYSVGSGLGKLLYGDVSVEVAKKLTKSLKMTVTYAYQVFNPKVENEEGALHHNNIVVADVAWRVNKQHALRFEGEWLGSDSRYSPEEELTDRRAGDWVMGLVEWNIGSRWFLTASDQVAYQDGEGNYYNFAVGYNQGATRLQIGFGKQRKGMLCIGGVCRVVPASNGLTFSLTTSF